MTEEQPIEQGPPMRQFNLTLPTSQRPCIMVVPIDLTEREALGMHFLVNQVYDFLYNERLARGGAIALPDGSLMPVAPDVKGPGTPS